ncbi:MAG: tricarballylate utilization 4Fe-4S protein TcuB [Betaproteobacteria bacterium]
MQPLETLARQAQALATGSAASAAHASPPGASAMSADEAEVAREMIICNACRYCEGFCAVFPAMTRRLDFHRADVHYLANLCHNCGACLHACQYAPPHEFAVNLPRALARVRRETYADFAWPPALGMLYRRNGLTVSLALAGAFALFLLLAAALHGSVWGGAMRGDFYRIFPHGLMVAMFLPVFAWAVFALGMGAIRFNRAVRNSTGKTSADLASAAEAFHDAARLRYLDGGHGEGCHNEDDAWTLDRKRFHHLTVIGFALCFASTSVATLMHYGLNIHAPYGWLSAPKLLGVPGGILMVWGTFGLWRLRHRRHPDHLEPSQHGMDLGFIALLFLAGATGLALSVLRTTSAMPFMLCVHLGAVMAFFLTMPYGKFAHAVFRVAALIRYSVERRQPNRLGLSGE